ncbi:MAG: hypothetical protein DVB25_04450 [Verrucomicrobia bacterium]|nr:MAG: hypothetical protein DVB25_04450 [Verrucomicrobiota bacterium]
MIRFDGILFNERNSRLIMAELTRHDPAHSQLSHCQVARRVSRFSFMSALAKLNGLAFFPRVAEYCEGSLHAACDTRVMTRERFVPLCCDGHGTLIVAIVNPWSLQPQAHLATRFPQFEIVRIVTLASEISRAIVSGAVRRGASVWRGEFPS